MHLIESRLLVAEEVEDGASLEQVEYLDAAVEGRRGEKVPARVEGHLKLQDIFCSVPTDKVIAYKSNLKYI